MGELYTVRFVPWFREEMSEASDEKVGRIPRCALERPVVKTMRKLRVASLPLKSQSSPMGRTGGTPRSGVVVLGARW